MTVRLKGVTLCAQHAYNGVADAGVAQVTDVRSFIAIDGRVLNNNFGALAGFVLAESSSLLLHLFNNRAPNRRAVQAEIQEAWFCYCNLVDGWIMGRAQEIPQRLGDHHWRALDILGSRHRAHGII